MDNSIKDTLAVKVFIGRSKYLLVITSYFPCYTKSDLWGKRWEDLIEIIGKYSVSKDNANIIIGCDFNRDISEDPLLIEQLNILNLNIIHNIVGSTYELNRKKSKIDHIIVSKNLDNEKLNLHKSLSDHKILSVVINNIEETE
jgi:hypothetical protein